MTAPRMIRCINGHVFDATAYDACPNCGWTEPGKHASGGSGSSNGSGFDNGGAPIPPNPNRNMMFVGAAVLGVIAIGVASHVFLKPAPVPVPDPIVKVPDRVAEKTPEKVPEIIREKALEKAPEVVPEKAPEKTTEVVPDKVPEKIPEMAQEPVPDQAPEKTPEKSPEKVPDAIPEKVIEKQAEPQPAIKVEPVVPPVNNGLAKFDALEPLTQDTQSAAAATLGLSPFATELALVTRATKLAERQPAQLQPQRMLIPFVRGDHPIALADAGSSSYFGYAVAVDDRLALDYLTRGADQGSVRARAVLAQMLLAGRGQPRDAKAAADLLILAARADSPFSDQIMQGLKSLNISLEGKGPTAWDLQKAFAASNWELSLKLASELADLRIAKGYHVRGLLSWSGNAVPKDQAAAIELFRKAAAIGFSPATESLSGVARSPPSGSGNIVEAMVLLEIAYLQSENKQRALYFTDRISELAGLIDRNQWAAIKTLFADIAIPGQG